MTIANKAQADHFGAKESSSQLELREVGDITKNDCPP